MSLENLTPAKTPEKLPATPEMISTAALTAASEMVDVERMELKVNMKGGHHSALRYNGKAEQWIKGGIAASLETFVKLPTDQAQDAAQYVVVEAKALAEKIKVQLRDLSSFLTPAPSEQTAA